MRDYLTASDFYRYIHCPHWPYYDRFATDEEKVLARPFSDAEKTRMENGVTHEKEIIGELMKGQTVEEVPATSDLKSDAAVTLELMKRGVPLIYQGTLIEG